MVGNAPGVIEPGPSSARADGPDMVQVATATNGDRSEGPSPVVQSRLYGTEIWGGGVKRRGLKVTRPPGNRTIRVTTPGHPIDVRRAFA